MYIYMAVYNSRLFTSRNNEMSTGEREEEESGARCYQLNFDAIFLVELISRDSRDA